MPDTSPIKPSGLRRVGRVIAWILAILFFLIALPSLLSGKLGSIIISIGFLLAGAVTLPPAVGWIRNRVPFARAYWVPPFTAFACIVLFMIIGAPMMPVTATANRPAQTDRAERDNKPSRRERDVAEVEALLAAPTKDSVKEALSILKRYRRDTEEGGELRGLFDRATVAKAAIEANEKVQGLLTRLAAQTSKVEAIYEKRPEAELTILANLGTMSDAGRTLEAALEANNNDEVRAAAAKLRSTLVAKQRASLPAMRAGYAAIKDEALWESDTDVEVRGAGNRTLRMVSVVFAANRNIAQVQRQAGDTLYLLRFSRSEYKWYRGSGETTYFTLKTPTDADVGYWVGTEFTPVPAP